MSLIGPSRHSGRCSPSVAFGAKRTLPDFLADADSRRQEIKVGEAEPSLAQPHRPKRVRRSRAGAGGALSARGGEMTVRGIRWLRRTWQRRTFVTSEPMFLPLNSWSASRGACGFTGNFWTGAPASAPKGRRRLQKICAPGPRGELWTGGILGGFGVMQPYTPPHSPISPIFPPSQG